MKIELSINIENELEQRAILDALGGINQRLNDIRNRNGLIKIPDFMETHSLLESVRQNLNIVSAHPEAAMSALDHSICNILEIKAKIKKQESDGITFHL